MLEGLDGIKKRVKDNINNLKTALNVFLEATVSIYTQELLKFWQTGLELADPESPDECPMCEADTLTQKKRNELQLRIKQSSGYSGANNKLKEECSNVQDFIGSLGRKTTNIFPNFLDEDQRQKLIDLFKDNLQPCDSFLAIHDLAKTSKDQTSQIITQLKDQVEGLVSKAAKADTTEGATQFVNGLELNLETVIKNVVSIVNNYSNSFNEFKDKLENRVEEESVVKEINGMIIPLEGWRNVEIVEQYKKLLDESLKIVRQIEARIKLKQDTLFAAKGQEIYSWYEMMNPGADVQYSRIEPGTDSLTLWAKTFGVEVNAVACLSECQLNCLGLSIHFTRVLTPRSPFQLIIMDDPVQSMDDDHSQALVVKVIEDLLQKDHQLFILTHDKGLCNAIIKNYRHRRPMKLRISEFQKHGPIVQRMETLEHALNRARELSNGNEYHRKNAVEEIRECCEWLMREKYNNYPDLPQMPYNATGSQMLPYLRLCSDIKPQILDGLSQTIEFSSLQHHYSETNPVPTQPQINPHFDRLRQVGHSWSILTNR